MPRTSVPRAAKELLTPEEVDELSARPMGSGFRALTDAQLALRVSAAKKFAAKREQSASMAAWARAIYEKAPVWGFYIESHPLGLERCIRADGVLHDRDDGDCVWASTVTPDGRLLMLIHPVPLSHLRRVAQWRPADLASFAALPAHEHSLMIDPLGHSHLSVQRARAEEAGTNRCEGCGRCRNKHDYDYTRFSVLLLLLSLLPLTPLSGTLNMLA